MRDSNRSSVFLRMLPALLVAALLVPGCVVRPRRHVVVHHPHRKQVVVHHPRHKTVVVHKHEHETVVVHKHKRPHRKVVTIEDDKGNSVTSVTSGKKKVVTVKGSKGNSVTVTKVKGKKKGHRKHGDDHSGKGKGHDDD